MLISCAPAAPKNCLWSDDLSRFTSQSTNPTFAGVCSKTNCAADELVQTIALNPEPRYTYTEPPPFGKGGSCSEYSSNPGLLPGFRLCCEPPSVYTKDWPVLPSYLWSDTKDDHDEDVTWEWADDFGNNNHDITPDDMDEHPGQDPYGFIMMEGPPGSIHNAFADAFTVVQSAEPRNVRARSLLTTNPEVLENVWVPTEETVRVYCNYPAESPHCRRVFYKGAKDTIIRLPNHVGEGPWARIVSMVPELRPRDDFPEWIQKKRSVAGNQNGKGPCSIQHAWFIHRYWVRLQKLGKS